MKQNNSEEWYERNPDCRLRKRIRSAAGTLFSSLTLILCLFTSASAMDFIVGAKAGYFLWDPFLQRLGVASFEDMEMGEGVLYGPVFSVLFSPDLSLSFSGLYGHQSANWQNEDFSRDYDSKTWTGNYSWVATRLDIDTAIVYRIAEFFKIFAGYKYQYNGISISSSIAGRDALGNITENEVDNSTYDLPVHGPALGIGFSMPLGERFFVSANLSALFMWGVFEMKPDMYRYEDGNTARVPTGPGSLDMDMRMRGFNFEPSVGASIGEGMPIFTVGCRVQWTQNKFDNPPSESGLNSKWTSDYLYGLFVGVLYPF